MQALLTLKDAIGKSEDGILKLRINQNQATVDNGDVLIGFEIEADDMEVFLPSREFSKAVSAIGELSKIKLSSDGSIIFTGGRTRVKIPLATEILSLVASMRGKATLSKEQVDASVFRTVVPIVNRKAINPFSAIFLGDGYAFTTDGVIILAMPCEWCDFNFKIPYSHADKLSLLVSVADKIDVEIIGKQMLVTGYAEDGSYATIVIPEASVNQPPALDYIKGSFSGGTTVSSSALNKAVSKLLTFTGSQEVHIFSTGNGTIEVEARNDTSEMKTSVAVEEEANLDAWLFAMYAKLIAPRQSEWVTLIDSEKILRAKSSNGAVVICAKMTTIS